MMQELIFKGNGIGTTMSWNTDNPLYFRVIEKSTGNELPIKYEADPMGFVHTFNAHEEDGYIVLDAPWQSFPIMYHVGTISDLSVSPDQLKQYMLENGPAAGLSMRYVLPLKAPSFTDQIAQIDSLGKCFFQLTFDAIKKIVKTFKTVFIFYCIRRYYYK